MTFQKICLLSELPEAKGREILVDGRIVAMFRRDNEVHALDGICAHQGGPISQGYLDNKCVTCPWHGWQYDISNGKNLLTGKRMLDCFPVEIRGDEVWLDVMGLDSVEPSESN